MRFPRGDRVYEGRRDSLLHVSDADTRQIMLRHTWLIVYSNCKAAQTRGRRGMEELCALTR